MQGTGQHIFEDKIFEDLEDIYLTLKIFILENFFIDIIDSVVSMIFAQIIKSSRS